MTKFFHLKLQQIILAQLLGAFNKFPDFFCTGIQNYRRLSKIQYVIAIHLMRWLTNSNDFRFKLTATAAIGIHPTKVWLSTLVNFKNAIWHFRRTICNKILFKLRKNATEMYGMLQTAFGASCKNRASVFERHKRFKEGRESVRDDERCGWSKEVNTPELVSQRVTVHNSILVTDYLTKMGIKTVPHPPYCPDLAPSDFWLFPMLWGCRYGTIEEMKEAVTKVIDTLT